MSGSRARPRPDRWRSPSRSRSIAGLVSFFSPCVIPLLPGYLSYATGLSGADLADSKDDASAPRGRMLLGSLLFVLGFAVVFVLVGAAFGSVGVWLRGWQDEITVVLGVGLILLGLVFAGVVPWLQREWRIHTIPAVGLGAAPLIGALFAIGWTPCIGPTYGVIVNLTYADATATRGALLSLCLRARARDPVHRRRAGLPPYPRRRCTGCAGTRSG